MARGRNPRRARTPRNRRMTTEQHHIPYDAISTLPDGLDKGVPHRALKARAKYIERTGDEGLRHAPPRAPRNTRQRCGRHTRPQVRFEAATPATAHARATSARAEKGPTNVCKHKGATQCRRRPGSGAEGDVAQWVMHRRGTHAHAPQERGTRGPPSPRAARFRRGKRTIAHA